MNIRDKIITGTFAIGADGQKEPIDWKDYALKLEQHISSLPSQSAKQGDERFKLPTDDQIVKMALVFNDGKLDAQELTNMVSMCMLVIDRLYENGDILIPSSKEK